MIACLDDLLKVSFNLQQAFLGTAILAYPALDRMTPSS
jgi:hypothetical protein